MTPESENKLFERLGGIDAKLDVMGSQIDRIEKRVGTLEWWKAKVAGMAIVVTAVMSYLTTRRG